VTLGQAPRVDVVPDIAAILPGVEIVEAGALDDACEDEIAELEPRVGEPALATRLRDGRGIAVSKPRLLPRLEIAIAQLSPRCGAVLLLCSGRFPDLASSGRVLYPDGILHGVVRGLLRPGNRLGVVSPLPSQTEMAGEKWADAAERVVGTSASAYGPPDRLAAAVSELDRAGSDLIVLDCMGFSRAHREVAQSVTPRPILLAPTVVAAVVSQVL
jgi:protein AroM